LDLNINTTLRRAMCQLKLHKIHSIGGGGAPVNFGRRRFSSSVLAFPLKGSVCSRRFINV